jgi:hypothetical protein
MGCWNKTCGISNLHIYAGQPVYVFVLEENISEDSYCYSTCLFKPCLLPFNSEYDDYGGGENSSGVGLPFILNSLREKLVELEVGENSYHDIVVKRGDFDIDKFFEACHENRLFVGSYHRIPVQFTMMRKDIVDGILQKFSLYDYKTKKDLTYADCLEELDIIIGEWQNLFASTLGRQIVLATERGFLDHLEGDRKNDAYAALAELMFSNLLFSCRSSENFAQRLLGSLKDRTASFIYLDQVVTNLVAHSQKEQLKELLADCLKGVFIDAFMDGTRKLWTPGGHEGSQNTDVDGHKILISTIQEAIDFQENQRANDDWPLYQS